MTNKKVSKAYLNWLKNYVASDGSRDKLLSYLFDTEFYAIIEKDENRINDGLNLRYDYIYDMRKPESYIKYFDGYPCSVLEVMIALADRMDRDITYDNCYGSRAHEWFWIMITNLGLYNYTDDEFDIDDVSYIVDTFLERRYARNGRGGLFYIYNPNIDMREEEIWYQMAYFLNENEYYE